MPEVQLFSIDEGTVDKLWEILILPICRLISAKTFVEIGSEEGKLAAKVLAFIQEARQGHLTVVDPKPLYSFSDWKKEHGERVTFFCSPSLDVIEEIPLPDVYLVDGDHNYYTVINELQLIESVAGERPLPLIFFHDAAWPYARRDLYYSPERIPEDSRHPYAKMGMKPSESDLVEFGGVNQSSFNALQSNTAQNGVLTAVEDFVENSSRDLSLEVFEIFNGLGIVLEKSLLESNPKLRSYLEQIGSAKHSFSVIESERVSILAERAELKAELTGKIADLNRERRHLLRVARNVQSKVIGNEFKPVVDAAEVSQVLASVSRGVDQNRKKTQVLSKALEVARTEKSELSRKKLELEKNSREWKAHSEKWKDQFSQERLNNSSLCSFYSGEEFKRLNLLRKKVVEFEHAFEQMFEAFGQTRTSLAFRTGSGFIEKLYKPIFFKPVGEFARLFSELEKIESDFRDWQNSKPSIGYYRLSHDLVERLTMASSRSKISRNEWRVLQNEFSCLVDILNSFKHWKERLTLAQASLLQSSHWKLGDLLVNKLLKRLVLKSYQSSTSSLRHFSQAESLAIAALDVSLFAYLPKDLPAPAKARSKLKPEIQIESVSESSNERSLASKIEVSSKLSSKEAISAGEGYHSNGASNLPIVVQFTPATPSNPYYNLFAESITSKGQELHYIFKQDELLRFLENKSSRHIVVHFHQLEPFYHSRAGSELETKRKANELVDFLNLLKSKNVRLIHTAHNPLPHNRQFELIDKELYREAYPLFDKIIVLGQLACQKMSYWVDDSKIEVIEHPSFRSFYGKPFQRSEARNYFGFSSEKKILGAIGQIKPYKGLENAIEAVGQLRKEGFPDLELVIAGKSSSSEYLDELKKLAGEGVTIVDQHIPNSEIPRYVAVFDASLFNFRDIWASSSVVLSLSYNVPVIVPRMGCLEDYVDEDNTGFFFESDSFESLVSAIRRYLECPYPEHLEYMCDRFNSRFSVAELGNKVSDIYRNIFDSV